jgi:hypothetical protein
VAEGQDQEIEEVGYTRAANLIAKSKPASIAHDGLEEKLDIWSVGEEGRDH